MMNIYKDLLPSLGGYLTDKDKMQLRRVELFVQEVARREPLYFQQRAIDEKDEEVSELACLVRYLPSDVWLTNHLYAL
jgi:5'-3' exonuclease